MWNVIICCLRVCVPYFGSHPMWLSVAPLFPLSGILMSLQIRWQRIFSLVQSDTQPPSRLQWKDHQSFIFTIHMKYRMYWMLQVKGLNGKYEIGAILLKTKSLQYNMTMQIYRNKCDFIYPCHILNSNNKKLDFSLSKSIHEFGSPENLIFYGTTV